MAPESPPARPGPLDVDLTLPADARYLSLVRVVVGAVAGGLPSLSESRIADLKLVATELFTNAIEANCRASRGAQDAVAPIRVRCTADAERVTLVVVDSGPGLDASHDPHPPGWDPRRLDYEHGLGLPLIQYLADDVDYLSSSAGTTATAVLAERDAR